MNVQIEQRKYKPAKVAAILSDRFGHKVTPSVIRKWDNKIYSLINKDRESGDARVFNDYDLQVFNIIAVMRNLGFDLEEIGEMLKKVISKNKDSFYVGLIEDRMKRQETGFREVRLFLRIG